MKKLNLDLRIDFGGILAFAVLTWVCHHKFGWTDTAGIVALAYILAPRMVR